MKKILALVPILLLAASVSHAQTTGTTTLGVTVGAEAAIVINTAATNFTEGSGSFAAYTASTAFTYYIRTISLGTITLEITSDFSPALGPSVATSGSTGDTLTYANTVQLPGTAAGGQPASTTAQTAVASFGANALSAKTGNTVNSVAWTLVNDPAYKASSYSAVATFTISAT